MDISAVYIKKLDDYRKLVSRKIKAKQTADLLTAINSYKLAEEEAANFYIRFDKAFIDLYPNFVEEFNQLLLPEKQIVLPAPNSLTKELRIYALMRLGITDGQELATLLFYSTQTIYNYKAAIRKRAKDLTTFDAAINRQAVSCQPAPTKSINKTNETISRYEYLNLHHHFGTSR